VIKTSGINGADFTVHKMEYLKNILDHKKILDRGFTEKIKEYKL
jgi:hypothetical protein